MLPRQGPTPEVSETGRRKARMIKYVTVLFRKAGISREEFSSYWKNIHAPILQQIPELRGYVQNHALPDPEGNEPPYDGFGELYFDSLEAMQVGLASPEGEATLADIPNFCDTQRLVRVFVDEVKFV
jgi:uncharacterized protein (TIGR02118 family)